MINNKDNLGNELSQEQIEYFKNTKIVDEKNNLLVCYHGSPNPNFKEFDPRNNKSQFGKYKFGDKNVNYFTTDRKSASTYTEFGYDDGTLFEVYLNIENPYIVDNKSEAEIKSHLNIKDDRLRKHQIELFDRIFNKWKGKILDYSDYRFDELNNDLHKLNLELRPSDQYEPDTDPYDIDYFDLWNLGRNSFIGAEHILEYQYSTDELFDDDMYDQLLDEIIGEDPNDYYFSTDDVVRFVLSLDENYDGIIIKDIHDSKDMFSDITTDIITLGSPNQIKSISNKNPSSSNRIDESRQDFYDANLLWKGQEYSEEPKTDRIRLYHQTMKENILSIIENGLQTKFKRWYDNPGGNVLWATDKDPTIDWSWNFGNALVVLDLPKDFDMRKVNSSEYNIYQDVDPKYINAIYLQSSYVKPIMRDFQNTLDIDKSIERYRNGELTESIDDLDFDADELAQLIDMEEIEEPKEEESQEIDKNSYWYKSMLDTIEQSRKYRKGTTFKLDDDVKKYLQKNYPDYSFKVVDLKDVIKRNNLDNPNHGMFGRRTLIWGDDPELYWYSKDKDNEKYNPIRLTQDLRVCDGNHRLWALYNMGYSKADVLVYNDTKLTESLLLEVSRNQMIDKSKRGKEYSKNNQERGKNRWERKRFSKIASTTKEFNSIDMNTFFKKDILKLVIPVQGETDNYKVAIRFDGALNEIQKTVQQNNNKLDYRTITQSLSKTFNNGDIYVNCSCPDFAYRFNYQAGTGNFWTPLYRGEKEETRPNRFEWTNSKGDMGGVCKHIALVISNVSWLMKVASVLNNYIHFAETNMQRQFADIIFPKIYGVKYPEAIQLGMFDRSYLKHSKGVIDEINKIGSTRGRFKKTKIEEPKEEIPNGQVSIFDIEKEEEPIETPKEEPIVDKKGNIGFKKQSIYDLGVEEPEEQQGGFKPRKRFTKQKNNDVEINKGFKQFSIFDDDEDVD